MRLIDADALEREGWSLCRTFQKDKDTMAYEVKKPSDFLTIEPERKKGEWIDETFKPWGLVHHPYKCDQCGEHSEADSDFCPNCGAEMRGEKDSAQPEPQWIPVAERLPEDGQDVLVTAKEGYEHWDSFSLRDGVEYVQFHDDDEEKERFIAWDNNGTDMTEYVTAWMPLPEPYKEKKE